MCHELEQIYREGFEKGFEKGELIKSKEIALSLTEMGLSVEQIALAVKINVDTVQQWMKENATSNQ